MTPMLLAKIWRKALKRWARFTFVPGWRVRLLRAAGARIGRDVYIADDFVIVEELGEPCLVEIGDRVSIAPRVTLVTSSHPNQSWIRPFAPVAAGPVVLEPDAWIGAGAILLPNVRIGRGAIVGAGSVVTDDVEPLAIVAGQPARAVGRLTPPAGWG